MATLVVGGLVLALLLWALSTYAKADPKAVARVLKLSGGIVALAGALFLTARGQFGLAIPLGMVGAGLMGWVQLWPAGFGARTRRSQGQISRVRSGFVEMELDHDTGQMQGRIVAGAHEGTSLDTLPVATLIALLADFDEESRALLMAYLDRRDARWREHAHADSATGRASPPASGKMTQEEAYQILGLQPGASAEEIGRAHRSLMKKLHPDQGGSTYLAARVNEAKEVLLRRHN
jgi:hypothetical protein